MNELRAKLLFCCPAVAVGLLLQAQAESNTTNILDGMAADAGGPFILGDAGSFNFLLITNAGTLTNTDGIIGKTAAAHSNLGIVSGGGSQWINHGSFYVGRAGSSNQLVVNDGAALQSSATFIGSQSSDNRFSVEGAGTIRSDTLQLGDGAGTSNNEVWLDGLGVVWMNSGRVTVGDNGSRNRFVVRNGATFRLLSSTSFTVGNTATSMSNEVLIAGTSRALLGDWSLVLGASGRANRLVLAEGAHLQSRSAWIGQNCVARDNVAMITGPGTVWSNGIFEVGFCCTNNQLVVSNGAHVFGNIIRTSVQGGGSNAVTVTGRDSLLRAAGDLIIGNAGRADQLLGTQGGRIEGRHDRLGVGGGSSAAFLSDAGTSWSNVSLVVGESTSGNQLTVADGAVVQSGGAMLGASAKAWENVALVAGADSAWVVRTNLIVGGLGSSNRLAVERGARVSARNVYVGAGSVVNPTALFSSDWNSALVDGPDSVLTVTSNVVVGAYGRWNRLMISGGAGMNGAEAVIGMAAGGSNSVLVTGPGSTWVNTRSLLVGSNALFNELTVADGGRVMNAAAVLGVTGVDLYAGSTCFGARESFSQVTVTGVNSVWENRGPVVVGGGAGGNHLKVNAGGTVLANGLTIGQVHNVRNSGLCAPVTNVVAINGGCLIVSNATADAVLEARYGSLRLSSGLVVADRLVMTNDVNRSFWFYGGTLKIRGGVLDTPGNSSAFQIGDLDTATLVLEGGTLMARDGLAIGLGSTIAGNGVVEPAPRVDGTIAPGGRGIGRLTFLGNFLSMGLTAALAVDIAGTEAGVSYDQLVTGNAILAGALEVRLREGFVPAPTDTFRIITCDFREEAFYNVTPQQRVLTMDRLGSFRIDFTVTNVVLSDYRSTDLDGDAIQDTWALNFFGHTPLTAAARAADADGDGATNLEEFRAGTDPLDPASVFRVQVLAAHPFILEFPRWQGKQYDVWYSNDLRGWHRVANPTFLGGGDFWDWMDDGKETGGLAGGARFYRVTLE